MTGNKELKKLIHKEITEYHEPLDINPSFAPTQKEILNLIDLYWVDKFKGNEKDSQGFRKVFYNIVQNPTLVASKMIDIDTKDILLIPINKSNHYLVMIMKKDLDIYMKENGFGKFLNQCVYEFPKYGHLLAKNVNSVPKIVSLKNIINQQDVPRILDSDYVTDHHQYTRFQLDEVGKNWDNVEKAKELVNKYDRINVYERHGAVPGSPYDYNIIAMPASKSGEEVMLYQDIINRDKLYKEVKLDEIPGRALGRGTVEKLFQSQTHLNKVAYLKSKSLNWTSKQLFQSADKNTANNLIHDAQDGDVIKTREISKIPLEERNLSAYREEEQVWSNLIDKLTFAFDSVTGETAPAGQPFSLGALQSKMAGGYFDLKKEDLGMFIKDIMYDWILPSFKKNRNREHSIAMSNFDHDEIKKLRTAVINKRVNKVVGEQIKKGYLPTQEEISQLEEVVAQVVKGKKDLTIPAEAYTNLEAKMDVVITGESIDMSSKLTTAQTLLQILGSNPTIVNDPRTRKVLDKILTWTGWDPADFDDVGEGQEAQIGGSIARPNIPVGPQIVNNQQQV